MTLDEKHDISLFERLRHLFRCHFYGGIFVYASFWTLMKQFLVVIACLFGVEEEREDLLKDVETTFKKKFEIDQKHQIVVGETARSLFYCFLLALDLDEDALVITTPLQHYSFIRIFKALNINTITVDMKKDGSGWNWEELWQNITPDQTRRVRACIVTHMYGFNQEYTEMAEWCHKHNIFIFEDCIQGYTLFQNHGHKLAHMSVFSGGMDKIPCTTKGGFGVVRHNKEMHTKINNIIANFPDQTWEKRFSDIMSQWAYWFMTATKLGTFFVVCYGFFVKKMTNLAAISHLIRKTFLKAYVGVFTVGRVSYRPSVLHLKAMKLGVERAQKMDVDMLHEGRETFREILGKENSAIFFPWMNGGDWLKGHANLYFHCLTRERDALLTSMSDNGWAMIYQQAWDYAQQHPNFPLPEHAMHLKENMIYLPVTHQMLHSEMEELAGFVKVHLEKYHPDGKPFLSKKYAEERL